MPPHAKVFVVEDNKLTVSSLEMVLPLGGHEFIGSAGNLEEIKLALAEIANGTLTPDVMTVDGRLPGVVGMEVLEMFTQALKERNENKSLPPLSCYTIGLSSDPFPQPNTLDVDLTKPKMLNLNNIITAL